MCAMSESTRIIVNGAAGRMGRAVSHVIAGAADVVLAAALVRPGSAMQATPTGYASAPAYVSEVPATMAFDVLVDVSGAAGFDAALRLAVERSVAFVSGSTGLDALQMQALHRAAEDIPVLWAANFSVGVAVLAHLVGEAARLLPDWDVEIIEAHHRHKRDAPSGTALMLGQRAAFARDIDFADPAADRRGPRSAGSIGFAVSRGGDVIGEHEVRLLGSGERIELVHRAADREIFARGAVKAASWLARQAPGRYLMTDMLGLGRA